MANTLRFKRGLVAGIPTAALGEPLFTTDTFDLYIGNGTGNTRFQKYIASGATTQILRGDGSLYTFPLNISSPSNGQVLKYDGTNWVNSADAGVTGSGTAGQVTYWGSSSTITGSNNLFWDNTNGRLGIGTNTPSELLNIYRAANTSGALFDSGLASSVSFLRLTNSGASGRSYSINVGGASSGFGTGSNFFVYDNTANATRLLINSSGNILVNSTTDNGLRFQVTGDGFFSGSVGIGTSSLTGRSLSVSKNITGQYIFSGGSYGVGVLVDGVIQSDEVGGATYFRSFAQTQAASFTAGAVYHFEAVQGTFGAGSTVSNQVGFFARETLIGATNNFGFYGNIASGTGRWNLYMNGTANNYMAGSLGIGSTSLAGVNLSIGKSITGATTSYGVYQNGQIQSDVTGSASYFHTDATTQATAFTLGNLRHYFATQGTIGAGSSITNQFGYVVASSLIGATNNYGFYGDIAAGTGRWNLYMNGTAANYLNGNLSLGTTNSFARINTFGHILAVNGTGAGSGSQLYLGSLDFNNSSFWNSAPGIGAVHSTTSGVASDLGFYTYAGNANSRTERARIFYTGNIGIGTTTDAGFRLDVNGTMRVSGASTFSSSVSISGLTYIDGAATALRTNNTVSYTSLESRLSGTRSWQIDNVSNAFQLYMQGASAYMLNVTSTGNVGLGTASPDARLRVAGAINSTQAIFGNVDGRGLAISTSIIGGTNEAGVILNARSSVTSGTFIFQTDGTQRVLIDSSGLTVTGGNGYEVVNSASNNVTALRPTGGGTSIMSTNSNGLHIAVGTEAAGDLILASNNTERIRLSSNGFFSQINATNPSASITDSYIQYSADVTAGNAAPHFRTENGAVIKLYQETTAVGNAIFSQGGGNAVLDDSTFAGYTIRQVVQALRNQGILQ